MTLMTTYANGQIPAPGQPGSPLQTIATGTDSNGPWEFQITAHTLWMWSNAKAYAEKHFGKTLHIRTGWNCYRPYAVQKAARARACAAGNCNAAASPGYSSHGGSWIDNHFTGGKWVDAMAIDVDPNGLTWEQVWEACTTAGFLCNAITIQRAGIAEPWHIIDLHPWDAVPANVGPVTDMTTTTTPPEEQPMSFSIVPLTDGGIYVCSLVTGKRAHIGSPYHVQLLQRARKNNSDDVMLAGELDIVQGYLTAVNPPAGATVDTDALAAKLATIDASNDAQVVKQAVLDAIAETVQKLV